MYYNRFMRREGCPTCGIENNNYRNAHSPNYYNNRNNSNSFINEPSNDIHQNSLSLYYSNLQRILTPPRNNFNFNKENEYYNSNINYNSQINYSPIKNSGCKNCSMSSTQSFSENDLKRPYSGNYLNRRSNQNILNNKYRNDNDNNLMINNNEQNNYKNNVDYNFRKIYEKKDDLIKDSFNQNRYYSPQRNFINTFSNSNINDNSNNNLYTQNNNYSNNTSNNIVETMLDNKYRNFLNDNINKYNYNNKNNNQTKTKNKNYYSPSIKRRTNYYHNNNNSNNNNIYLNPRYKYLLPKEQNDIDISRFINLNIYNYQRELREIIEDRKTFFLFIFGTHDNTGKSWCSDCNIAMPNVEEAKNIIKDKKNEKEVYFISLPIDKINMDYLNSDPIIQLERVPTLIYFENGKEKNRLIEGDLFSKQIINNFILQAYEQYNPRGNQYLYQPKNYY